MKPTHFVITLKDVTEARTISQQISYQARHDKLTGLLNRHEFEAQLNQLLHSDFQPGASHAFCFLDLDRFKIVNDSAGDIAGDELLRQIASLFQERVRTSDTLARLGGYEFGILMQGCPLDRAVTIADNICNAIAQLEFTWQQQSFSIGVSIGVIRIDNSFTSVTELLQQADAACYTAKNSGRNKVHLLQPEEKLLAGADK